MPENFNKKEMNKTETPKKIPIRSRVIKEQAETTIQHFIDAAVELITNCDDSYKRLEQEGVRHNGRIEVYVSRAKGGMCREFWVRDFAEGMRRKDLQKSIEYGGETSGFQRGKSVRGLFGRGLKEAIISLGEGEIFTVRDSVLNIAKIWWDEDKEEALYRLTENLKSPYLQQVDEDVKNFVNEKKNGTLVKIKVKNEKMKIPEYNKFKTQISNHYALRDINLSKKRNVILIFDDRRKRSKNQSRIKFDLPEGELIINKSFRLPKYSDRIRLKVWESPTPLSSKSPRLDPCVKTGILIKTKGAILDNQLFKYDSDLAAFYFWGEAYCEGIAKRVKKGEKGIIDPNRAGIRWRHKYCQSTRRALEKELTPVIQKKKKELEKGEEKKVPRSTKRMLNKLCRMLDVWARKEFREWETPVGPDKEIEILSIVPRYANIEINKPRVLSIYAPRELIDIAGTKVSIRSENPYIKIKSPGTKRLGSCLDINLNKHPKNSNLWYGFFKIVSREIEQEGFIYCKLGHQQSSALVKVGVQKVKPPPKKKGGFISDIITSGISNPIQRVQYEDGTGKIKIFIKFSGVTRYLSSGLKGIETKEGKAVLAELVGEAFCRALALKRREIGEAPAGPPGSEIEAFISTVNDFQKKYLDKIHELVLNWELK